MNFCVSILCYIDKAVVHIPEGPFNPTNYSGTQFNFWGVSPNGIPQIPVIPGEGAPNLYGGLGTSTPYGSAAQQLGYMTNRMLQVITCIKNWNCYCIVLLCYCYCANN